MGNNHVRNSTLKAARHAEYVDINIDAIVSLAKEWAQEDLPLPKWDPPFFIPGHNKKVIDFFMTGNVINYMFNDIETGQKWEYEKNPFQEGAGLGGAFGMWYALSQAHEAGVPITEGKFLKQLSRDHAAEIFRGNFEIPLLDQRVEMLNEVGTRLVGQWGGHFHNMFYASQGELFTDRGLVTKLTREFSSFRDEPMYTHGNDGDQMVFINKRAQLGPAMLYARFASPDADDAEMTQYVRFRDINQMTVFADYNLPIPLRMAGILSYAPHLEQKIWAGQEIESGSQEEVEIRIATIVASDFLMSAINDQRPADQQINALQLDYKLFSEGRNMAKAAKKGGPACIPYHICASTAY